MGTCVRAATVAEGIRVGQSAEVGVKGAEKILEIHRRYAQWIEDYRDGMPALNVAAGIAHESGGDPLSTSDPKIQECGLWSVLGSLAEEQDLDPFDPEANIFMGARLRNRRVAKILNDDRYNWLAEADPYDYTKLVWTLPGSLGMGGWRMIMTAAFGEGGPSRELSSWNRRHPYKALQMWVQNSVDVLQKLMDSGERIGRMTVACVACRIMRTSTVDWLKEQGSLATPGVYGGQEAPHDLPEFDHDKYEAVWATPKKERHARFPEYLRVPGGSHGVSDDLDIRGGF